MAVVSGGVFEKVMGRGRFLFDLWGLCLVTHACAAAFLAGVLATVLPAAIRRGCCCRWQRHCAGFSAVIFYVLVLLCRFLCCCVSWLKTLNWIGQHLFSILELD